MVGVVAAPDGGIKILCVPTTFDRPLVGAGEAPIVDLAPAISNTIFDGARIRIRSLLPPLRS